MIDTLTPEQETALVAVRTTAFARATATEPADRPRAEAAARRMGEIAGVRVDRCVWVASPAEGAAADAANWASLRASLRDSLSASLRDSLSDSLWASLRDSLWDAGWLAFYAFPEAHLGVVYAPETAEKLRLHTEIAESCFALWLLPGTAILCERPATVEIVEGRLVGLTWRDANPAGGET